MAKEEVEKWAFAEGQITVRETVEKWGLPHREAEKLFESIETSTGGVFELVFAVSGCSPARGYALVPSSQLATSLSHLSNAQVELYGLRLKHTPAASALRQAVRSTQFRLEASEADDKLYAAQDAGVGAIPQFRRSVFVHKRGPSPDGSGSRRASFRQSFGRPGAVLKRKAESPLRGGIKKPKVGKRPETACVTLHNYFK